MPPLLSMKYTNVWSSPTIITGQWGETHLCNSKVVPPIFKSFGLQRLFLNPASKFRLWMITTEFQCVTWFWRKLCDIWHSLCFCRSLSHVTLQRVESGETSTRTGGTVIMWQYAPVNPGIVCHLAGVFWVCVCAHLCYSWVSTFLLFLANELTEQVKSNSTASETTDSFCV